MIRRVIAIGFTSLFLGWAAWYVSRHGDEFAVIFDVGFADVTGLVVAFVVMLACNGVSIALTSAAFGIAMTWTETQSLSFASSFANYFLPMRGGAGLRAVYLGRLHGLQVSKFVSGLGVIYLMHVALNGLTGLAGMTAIALDGGTFSIALGGFFAATSAAGLALLLANFEGGGRSRNILLRFLQELLQAAATLRNNPGVTIRLWLTMSVMTAASIWQCAAAFRAVSIPISWGGILVYAASKNLSTLVSLTPGSLGIVELIGIYLGRVLDYSTADALLVQGLIRAVAISVLLLLGVPSLLYLRRRIADGGREPQVPDAAGGGQAP